MTSFYKILTATGKLGQCTEVAFYPLPLHTSLFVKLLFQLEMLNFKLHWQVLSLQIDIA